MTQIISLSDRAAERIKEIMSKDQNSLGVRVGVKSGGCAGMAYRRGKGTVTRKLIRIE